MDLIRLFMGILLIICLILCINFKKLDEREMDAVGKINNVFYNLNMIKCTACHYCTLDNDCPRKIKIPELFACYNRKKIFQSWNQNYYNTITATGGKASECIKCGKCEKICPQHQQMRNWQLRQSSFR